MAVLSCTYQSPAIGQQTGCLIILPDQEPSGPLPVVYQLHGLSDNHTTWHRRTAIERHAQAHQVMIVCPEGGRGFYTNAAQAAFGQWEDHILHLVDWIDGRFHTRAERTGRAIGGLSMGGYGAVKLGLKHPDRFASIASHSGVLDPASSFAERHWDMMPLIYGDAVADSENPFRLAESALTSATPPRLAIDCGTEDFLIQHNRDLHAHLDQIGYQHRYEEYPGAHTWDYWDQHVVAALAFHAEGFTR